MMLLEHQAKAALARFLETRSQPSPSGEDDRRGDLRSPQAPLPATVGRPYDGGRTTADRPYPTPESREDDGFVERTQMRLGPSIGSGGLKSALRTSTASTREPQPSSGLAQLALPSGGVARTPEEAREVARQLGGAVVVKAQVPAGGRGRAGGIGIASQPDEAREIAARLLGRSLLGHPVECVLVEELLPIQAEMYLSFLLDPARGTHTLLFSPQGGMEIEEMAATRPGSVVRMEVDPLAGLTEEGLAPALGTLGMDERLLRQLVSAALALYPFFVEEDLLLVEVNPLAVCPGRPLLVADLKVETDDDANFRHPERQGLALERLDERERAAHGIGVSFVSMDGDVGVIASGAGLGMATLDLLQAEGLRPANFLDTGGGITESLMYRSVRLILEPARVRAGVINLYGGINPMVEAAQGIVQALGEMERRKPIVVKLVGNRQEEAWAILEGAGVPVVKTVRTEEAAKVLASLVKGGQR